VMQHSAASVASRWLWLGSFASRAGRAARTCGSCTLRLAQSGSMGQSAAWSTCATRLARCFSATTRRTCCRFCLSGSRRTTRRSGCRRAQGATWGASTMRPWARLSSRSRRSAVQCRPVETFSAPSRDERCHRLHVLARERVSRARAQRQSPLLHLSLHCLAVVTKSLTQRREGPAAICVAEHVALFAVFSLVKLSMKTAHAENLA